MVENTRFSLIKMIKSLFTPLILLLHIISILWSASVLVRTIVCVYFSVSNEADLQRFTTSLRCVMPCAYINIIFQHLWTVSDCSNGFCNDCI